MNNSPNHVLNVAIAQTHNILNTFITSPQTPLLLPTIFGETIDIEGVISWLQNNNNLLPEIEIKSSSQINYAKGAYSPDTNKIYLAEEFLVSQANNISAVSKLLIEELGHFLDHQFNTSEGLGDEGELFAAIVTGEELTAEEITTIQTEDDRAIIELDDKLITIEQANFGDNPAFDLIGLTRLRNEFPGIDGSNLAVAVIDTGIEYNHSLLAPNYVTGVDFVDNDGDPRDDQGHGTHVAGTVGATDETVGVAPDVDIIALDVFPSNGLASTFDVNRALQWVLDNHEQYKIVAVNMSLGFGFFTSENQLLGDPGIDLVNRLEREGITVVSAAGNSYQFKDRTNGVRNEEANLAAPSIYSTLAVGAVWQDDNDPFGYFLGSQTPGADRVTVFSQRLNTDNFILAPGALINSTSINGGLELKPGTSMASPHVAGAVALLQEAALEFGGRLLTTDEVVDILRSTADIVIDGDDEADTVTNTGLSFPRLNIYNAVVELRRRFNGIAPPPDPGNDLSADPNGTILGAFIAPILNGAPVAPISGIIGIDGNGTTVGDKDVDIFRFEVASPGTVTIELGTRTNNPQDFDTYLRLFDANGNQIAVDDDGGKDLFSRIETDLAPGTYYAGVSGYNNSSYNPNVAGSGVSGATGNYSLQLSLTNSDPNGLISGAREVILGNDLEPLIFPDFIGADYGLNVGVSDVDLFRVVAPDNGQLFIDIDTPYSDGEFVDSFLRLFDEEGNELVFASNGEPFENDNARSFDKSGNFTEFENVSGLFLENPNQTNFINGGFDSNNNYFKGNYGHRTDSFLGVIVKRGQVYHIGVSNQKNQDYDPKNFNNRLETGTGGSYELIVSFINNDINGTITQVTSTTALPIANRPEVIGEDDGAEVGDRDVDFWKFNSADRAILEIDINSGVTDTVALLFDKEGKLLADNDDRNQTDADPLLRYQIQPNTDYFVGITGYGNQNFDPFGSGSGAGGETGEYNINANLLAPDQIDLLSDNRIDSEAVRLVNIGDRINSDIGEDNGLVLDASDVDLYRFIPDVDATVKIRASTDEEFSGDTFLRLFDNKGQEITFNDDENSQTRGSLIEQEVKANTEYIIGVNGKSDRAREYDPVTGEGAAPGIPGSYTLSITDSILLDTTINRFQNRDRQGTYLFANEQESIIIRRDFPNFIEEGQAFKVAVEPGDDLIQLNRFQNEDVPGTYLFADEAESVNIRRNFPNFIEEGVAFYVYGADANKGVDYFRLQNKNVPGTYIFVDEAEKDSILTNFPNDFELEGIAFEVAI